MIPIIIYPPTIDWDYLHQRPQQLFRVLSRQGYICVFCNPNLHGRRPNGIQSVSDTLILANGVDFPTTVAWVRSAYPQSPVVAYFTYPPHVFLIRSIKPDLILFDSVDEPTEEFASWEPHYREAVQFADVVTASAKTLVNRARPYAREDIHYLPNGCDYEHFQLAQKRQRVDCHPFTGERPIIGYIGALAPWLNRPLINLMARSLPDYEFVFIGPMLLQNSISFTSANVHYLGHKNYADLPRYLSNFSHCLIPFSISEMTKGADPIKFWEYLASGIPILSTPLPELPAGYFTAIREDMFPGFLPSSDESGRSDRIALAKSNSWTERGRVFSAILSAKLEHG